MLRGILTDRRLSASVGTGLGRYTLTGRRSNVSRPRRRGAGCPVGDRDVRDFVTAGAERLLACIARSNGKIAALAF